LFKIRNVFSRGREQELYQRINDIANLIQTLHQNIQALMNNANQIQKSLQAISSSLDRNDKTLQDAIKVINSSTADITNRVAQMSSIVNQFDDTSRKLMDSLLSALNKINEILDSSRVCQGTCSKA